MREAGRQLVPPLLPRGSGLSFRKDRADNVSTHVVRARFRWVGMRDMVGWRTSESTIKVSVLSCMFVFNRA